MGEFKSHFSAWGLGTKVLSYLVSLQKSSIQTERDHQERIRVHSCQGVKAGTTAFLPISDSRGDSVSKKPLFSGTKK